jgi:hypothetical protein
MNAIKDPKMAAMIGQNPNAQAIGAAAMAHISQHLAFQYRKQMEQLMGIQLPPMEEDNPEGIPREMEVQISAMAAQASNMLLGINQNEVAAQQAQQAAQDPVIQMQAQELQLKQAKEQREAMKDQADVQLKAEQMQIERERIASQERIANSQVGAKAMSDKEKLELEKVKEGFQISKEIANANKPQQPQKGNKE